MPENPSTETVLAWFQLSRFARDYELRSESGAVQAKLNFAGLFTKNAVAEAAGHQWALHMEGIWRQRVIATRRGEREPELVMTMAPLGWAGRGTVTLRGGQTYQ